MKILQLCKKIPYPLKDGESIAIHFLSKGLVKNGCEVSLLSLNTKKHRTSFTEIPSVLAHYYTIDTVDIDTTVRLLPLLKNLINNKSYNIERFIIADFEAQLIKKLKTTSYDVVQLETLYMAAYIPTIRKYSTAKISMRSHNLENEIWTNLAEQTSNPLKSWYFGLCANRLAAFEKRVQCEYDILLPISLTDLQKYEKQSYNGASCLTPVGLDMDKYGFSEPSPSRTSLELGYIGSLDWKPNEEGLEWLFNNAWKRIKEKHPQLKFHLAGRNGDGKYRDKKDPHLIYHGEVNDAIEFMKKLDILLVPLFSGSGIRVKILESMALGRVVISTEKGFEGIPVKNGLNGYVFSNESELLFAIEDCKSNISKLKNMAAEARQLVESNFSYKYIAAAVVEAYKELVG